MKRVRKNDLYYRIESRLKKGKRWIMFDSWMEDAVEAEKTLLQRINDYPKRKFRMIVEPFNYPTRGR